MWAFLMFFMCEKSIKIIFKYHYLIEINEILQFFEMLKAVVF